MAPITIALLAGTFACGLALCVLAFHISRYGNESLHVRVGLLVTGLCFFGCIFSFFVVESTRPLTEQELAKAQWSAQEWQEVGTDTGIFRVPSYRQLTCRTRTLQSEDFPQILARFKAKHPNLEIVIVTPTIGSNGGASYTQYFTVITKPKSK